MNAFSVSRAYAELLARVPPKVMRTEEENERYLQAPYELEHRSGKLTAAEKELAELLSLLIEDFEEKNYQLPAATPLEVLSFLMDQHGLKQKVWSVFLERAASSPWF